MVSFIPISDIVDKKFKYKSIRSFIRIDIDIMFIRKAL